VEHPAVLASLNMVADSFGKRYGQDAEAMLSQPATKLFLRPPSRAPRSGFPMPLERSKSNG
jgi:hypothetical protein